MSANGSFESMILARMSSCGVLPGPESELRATVTIVSVPKENTEPGSTTGSVTALPPTGRLIGIDVGTVRVGLAVCDADRLIASPLGTYTRRSAELDADHYRKLVKAEGAVGFVVGLPVMLDGTEQTKAAESRRYGAWLAEVTGLPVAFWDERFTSALAEDALREAKVSFRKRKDKRDRIAAQMIMQAYLDAGCPSG
jgi:putative Holliday junction resolvase